MLIAIAVVLLIIAIAVFVLHKRAHGDERPAAPTAAKDSHPDSITIVDAPPVPRPPAAAPAQDPDATMVYMRPGQAPAQAAPRKGDDVPTTTLRGVHLIALNGANKGRSFPVATAGITIGRSSSCDIVLTDSCVSGQHAWIGLVDGKLTLRDLGSTNGTFLNAQLRTSISEAPLRPGDTIFIGGHLGEQFRLEAD
jgi:pSer/pThr/pTyr-binding forkhead associated (FHA) protein